MNTQSLTERMWDAARPVYEQILTHPFIAGLTDGTLGTDRFAFYLTQDVKYIDGFVKIMAAMASRAPTRADVAMLSRRAGEVAAEHQLHDSLRDDLDITLENIQAAPTAPTCHAYLTFLRSEVQLSPFLEALGAMLACPWIYWEVGKHLIDAGSPNPLYQRWIERYGGEIAAVNVPPLLELTDRIALHATTAQQQRAIDNFVIGCRYEWMFWDMGYTKQRWPV